MSQEYVAVDGQQTDNVRQRIHDMETMVSELLRTKRQPRICSNDSGRIQTALNIKKANLSASSIISPSQQNLNDSFSLSRYLYSTMPQTSITMMIFTQANYLQMPFQMLCRLRDTTYCDEQSPLVRASRRPSPTSHPVIFAQQLYKIALCLLQLEPAAHNQTIKGVKEPAPEASKRLVDIAIKHVTSHDALMANLDGIETLMLESGYYLRIGNHNAAWLTLRRAIGLAELIGLRKMRPGDDGAESLWYLLNYCDRFVSVIFGLPCNSSDNSFASKGALAGKSLVERLDRIQVALLGRIIDRNMKMQCCNRNDCSDNDLHTIYEQTKCIDRDLMQSANILPVDPWILPNSSSSATDKDVSKRTGILRAQMHHCYLLLLLHQPYFLWKSCLPTERMHDPVDHRYSKLATLSAGRDLLNKFLTLRDVHHASAYGGLDHKAWLASATLLLAYIDTHRSLSGESLEDQRRQDIGLIHRLIDRFKRSEYRSESVQQICTLLDIESNAANGQRYCLTWNHDAESATVSHSLQLSIPYFGTISVSLAEPEMLESWITATDLPLSEGVSSGLADYEIFQGNDFAPSGPIPNSGIMSTSFSLEKYQEVLPTLNMVSSSSRTDHPNFGSKAFSQDIPEFDID